MESFFKLPKLSETITAYFETYVVTNIDQLFQASGDTETTNNIVKFIDLARNSEITEIDYKQQLNNWLGDTESWKKIFLFYRRLVRGELTNRDLLISSIIKMGHTIDINALNEIISKQMEELTTNYISNKQFAEKNNNNGAINKKNE